MRPIDKRKNREQRKPKQASWLDRIQQDSWQLELVISGIAIFLLLQVLPILNEQGKRLLVLMFSGETIDQVLVFPVSLLVLGTYGLVAILFFHLVLRGLWIGAIGLRSVSGGFDFEELDFQPKFDTWLRRRLGTFDGFIGRLEERSSLAFSLAFLLFFAIVGLWMFINITVLSSIYYIAYIRDLSLQNPVYILLALLPLLIWCLMGLAYMVDFATMGYLKKVKWLQKIYFPIYRLFSWITLARFYRPLYYNLIDHPFGRKMIWVIVPLVFVVSLIGDIKIGRNPYFPELSNVKTSVVSGSYLDDGEMEWVQYQFASLESRYAREDYLEVFTPYLGLYHNPILKHQFPDLTSAKIRGFGFSDIVSTFNPKANTDSLLIAHNSLHRVYLGDSLLQDIPWRLYHHPKRKQDGWLFALPVYDLERGEHCLKFDELRANYGYLSDLVWETQATICFLK